VLEQDSALANRNRYQALRADRTVATVLKLSDDGSVSRIDGQ
jgi:hypothetical protein